MAYPRILAAIAIIAAIAICGIAYAQSVNVPTIVVSLRNSSSPAAFAIYNGGSAVTLDSHGNIDIYSSTDIRFIIQCTGTDQYTPVGISFQQTAGTPADPDGKRNFPIRSVSDSVLTVKAGHLDLDWFTYAIVYKQASDGTLHQVQPDTGGTPMIRNH